MKLKGTNRACDAIGSKMVQRFLRRSSCALFRTNSLAPMVHSLEGGGVVRSASGMETAPPKGKVFIPFPLSYNLPSFLLLPPSFVQNYMVTFGAPENAPGSVTFAFYRVFEACMLGPANPLLKTAYAHYFGCGMHLLHLIPVQGPPMLSQALER